MGGTRILLSKSSRASIVKKIGQVSNSDRIIRVYAQVIETNPFIIGDGGGRALVRSICKYKEGQKLRVIGHFSAKENSNMPEIDPIVIQDMSNFDFEIYNEMQQVKKRVNAYDQHGK